MGSALRVENFAGQIFRCKTSPLWYNILMSIDYVKKGKLYEFVYLGVGMVLEIRSSREPVLRDKPVTDQEFLCKAYYVVDVLVGDVVHLINFSVHWYHPEGTPQGWWSYVDTDKRPGAKNGWYGVFWL